MFKQKRLQNHKFYYVNTLLIHCVESSKKKQKGTFRFCWFIKCIEVDGMCEEIKFEQFDNQIVSNRLHSNGGNLLAKARTKCKLL